MATLKKSKKVVKKSTKKRSGAGTNEPGVKYQYNEDDPDFEKNEAQETKSTSKSTSKSAPVSKSRVTVQDEVTKFLSKFDSAYPMVTAIRKSKYFATINRKSFDKTTKETKTLAFGLLRMRMGNLLRGAISKAAKEKGKKKTKN